MRLILSDDIETIKGRLVETLMAESKLAWETGLQNCSGPIQQEEAEKLINQVFEDYA